MNMPADDDRSEPLMTTRTALILVTSVFVGLGTAVLLLYAGRHPAEAAIGGVTTFIASIKLLHNWIKPD